MNNKPNSGYAQVINKDEKVNYSVDDNMVECTDGYMLAASVYRPESDYKGAIMIGPATGIKRQFYTGIAVYLAENGFGVFNYACSSGPI